MHPKDDGLQLWFMHKPLLGLTERLSGIERDVTELYLLFVHTRSGEAVTILSGCPASSTLKLVDAH